jgi:transcriptional regulator with XRE-family HTH domain
MNRDKGASVRQRRVSAELRALRQERNLTCQQVADALDCSVSKISRMETGVRGLYPEDVAIMLGYYQAPARLRDELLELVREGQQPNWIQVAGVPKLWRDLMRFENDAIAIFNFEPLYIPGLLQTGDYARAVIGAVNRDYAEGALEQLVRTRMGRQSILSRFGGPTLSVIMDEMALRRPVGESGVMRGQLQHLLNMAERPRIEIRVVPMMVGEYSGLDGPAMILEFADQPTLVYSEIRGANGFLEESAAVSLVKVAWQEIRSVALAPDDSARLIAEIAGS